MKNKLILITGANGLIGSYITSKLLKEGYRLRCAVRSKAKQLYNCENIIIRNIDGFTEWSHALTGVHTVIHMASRKQNFFDTINSKKKMKETNIEGTSRLVDECKKANVNNFIYISSCSVYGKFSESYKPFNSDSKVNPSSTYARSKYDAETIVKRKLLNSKCTYMIIRIPFVITSNVKNILIVKYCMSIFKYFFPLPLQLKNNKRSVLSVENFYLLTLSLINQKRKKSGIFLAKNPNDISSFDILSVKFHINNCKFVTYPSFLLSAIFKLPFFNSYYYKLFKNFQIDDSSTRTAFNWTPSALLFDDNSKI